MNLNNQTTNENLSTLKLLLNSAKQTFLKCGYQAAPLRKITADIGFTPGALYGYFNSKEELFYALTDPMANLLMNILNNINAQMNAIPQEKRLYEMGNVYYKNIPKIVDALLSDRDAVRLIVNCSKGTKYEGFLDNIAKQNAQNINNASKTTDGKSYSNIQEETMIVLMDGYIKTLFTLILSDKPRETIIECMEMIGKIYEIGIITLMKKENKNVN